MQMALYVSERYFYLFETIYEYDSHVIFVLVAENEERATEMLIEELEEWSFVDYDEHWYDNGYGNPNILRYDRSVTRMGLAPAIIPSGLYAYA